MPMLDLDTLRFIQACVAALTFALVFFGTYLPSRAPYAGWWSLVVVASSLSTAMYAFTAQPWGWASDAVGQSLGVLGASFSWAAARSLRHRRHPALAIIAAPLAVLVTAPLVPRHEGVLAGTFVLLVGMTLMFGLAAAELWSLAREHRRDGSAVARVGTHPAVLSVAVASTVMSGLYGVRIIAFLAVGPTDPWYEAWTGPAITTVVITMAMVVVTYSVTELARFEIAERWNRQAMRDDLTGLLHRTPFVEEAQARVDRARGGAPSVVVVLADIDSFKKLNDTAGHAQGDRVLIAVADACRALLGEEDLACRLGGDEFALALSQSSVDQALALAAEMGADVARRVSDDVGRPTLSFGIATARHGDLLADAMERADQALYEAKTAGRDRAVVHADDADQADL